MIITTAAVVGAAFSASNVFPDIILGRNGNHLLLLWIGTIDDAGGFDCESIHDHLWIVSPSSHVGVTNKGLLVFGFGTPVPHKVCEFIRMMIEYIPAIGMYCGADIANWCESTKEEAKHGIVLSRAYTYSVYKSKTAKKSSTYSAAPR